MTMPEHFKTDLDKKCQPQPRRTENQSKLYEVVAPVDHWIMFQSYIITYQ